MAQRARWANIQCRDLRAQLEPELIDEADPLRPSNIPGAIMVDESGDILDGFHRAAGVCAARHKGLVPVVQVLDEQLARRISEPFPHREQEAAIDEALEEAGNF